MPKQAGNRSSRRLLRQTTYGSFGTLNRVHALSCSLVVKYFGEAVLRLSARRRVRGNCPVRNATALGMARPGNQHRASCIGPHSLSLLPSRLGPLPFVTPLRRGGISRLALAEGAARKLVTVAHPPAEVAPSGVDIHAMHTPVTKIGPT